MRKDEKAADEKQQRIDERTDEKKQADENLRAALEYGAKGFKVIPVCCGQSRKGEPDYKAPFIVGGHGAKDGTTDPVKIREWFAGNVSKNIGITCQNLLVLDVDVFDSKTGKEKNGAKQFQHLTEKLGPLPYGPVAKTGTGGMHYFFKRPDADIPGRAKIPSRGSVAADNGEQVEIEIDSEVEKLDIDIRAGDEYVVAPPSVNQNGKPYIWLIEPTTWDDLPELPPKWIAFLSKKDSPRSTPAPATCTPAEYRRGADVVGRCARFVETMRPAVQGQDGHGQLLNVAIVIFWDFGLSREEGWPIYMDYCARCLPPYTNEGEIEHKYQEAIGKKGQESGNPQGWRAAWRPGPDTMNGGSNWAVEQGESEPAPIFPIECFPDFFREYCEAVARTVAVDVSFPAYALLSGAAHATAYRAFFSYRHYEKERPFFHSMLVAHSGAGKSPVWKYMLFPLDEKEERIRLENLDELSKWRGLSQAEKKKTPPPILTLSQMILKPTLEKIESAVSQIWEQSRGLDDLKHGVFLPYDEGAYLLQSMDAYKGNGAKGDQSALIPMMDGQYGGSDRVGLDANGMPTSRYFADCHITIYATVQDKMLKRITRDKPEFFHQGFLQRFAFSVPAFVPKKPLSETEDFDLKLKADYRLVFNELFNTRGLMTLSDKAEKIYLDYEARKTADYNARGELGEARSGFDSVCLSLDRKGMKQVLEVAALLNVLNTVVNTDPAGTDERKITAQEMEGAIKIMEFRERSFHRLFKLVGTGEHGETLDSRIEKMIEERGETGLPLRDITRKFFRGKNAETVSGFMHEMIRNKPKIKMRKGPKGGEIYFIQP